MIASEFIGKFEGCHKVKGGLIWPYVCPAGYWTQGWGRLVPASSLPQTQETVDGWFRQDILKHENFAFDLSPILQDQSEARQTAIISFVYNLGPTRYQNSTLRKRINTSNWVGAQVEIQKWVFGGGKKLPGLVLRRAAEAALLR